MHSMYCMQAKSYLEGHGQGGQVTVYPGTFRSGWLCDKLDGEINQLVLGTYDWEVI